MRFLVNHPANGRLLHPCSNKGYGLSSKIQSIITAFKSIKGTNVHNFGVAGGSEMVYSDKAKFCTEIEPKKKTS